MSADPIEALITAIAAARIPELDVFSADAVVDATVPNWRFTVRGHAVTDLFALWYKEPGGFDELQRTDLDDGAILRFKLAWEEDGEPYAAHQLHHITTREGRIVADTVFCGGRWPAALQVEMEQAAIAAH